MKIKEFLSILSLKERLIFLWGKSFEKISNSSNGFNELQKIRKFTSDIQQLGFSINITKDKSFLLKKEKQTITLRKKSSDFDVFQQVYINKEYQPVIDCIRSNNIKIQTIVDAGSNIGLTSNKLIENFPDAHIICLEPDPENFKQLQKNLDPYKSNITFLNKALWYENTKLFLDFTFRDGKDWSRSVSAQKTSTVEVEATHLDDIIKNYNLSTIDLLKIDIEGSEKYLFREGDKCDFLDKTKLIALEIHDELTNRMNIYNLLRSKGYVLFDAGELTIGVNKNRTPAAESYA